MFEFLSVWLEACPSFCGIWRQIIELHDVVGWGVLWVEIAWFLFFLILNFGLWPRKRCNLFTVLFVGSNLLLQGPSTLEIIRKLGTRASSNFLFFSSRSQTDFLEIWLLWTNRDKKLLGLNLTVGKYIGYWRILSLKHFIYASFMILGNFSGF